MSASRSPDYAGNGGWYNNSVEVSFSKFSTRHCRTAVPEAASIRPRSRPPRPSAPAARTGLRDRGRQGGQRLGTGLPDRAGRGHPADPRNRLSRNGTDGKQCDRESDCVGPVLRTGKRPQRHGSDRHEPRGEQTITRTAVSHLGFENDQVVYDRDRILDAGRAGAHRRDDPDPGPAGSRSAGAAPTRCSNFGLTYSLQHHNAAEDVVDRGLQHRIAELRLHGRRVQGSDPSIGLTSEYSPDSAPVVVDRTPPGAPTAGASRAPDFAGKGGWYKDSVTVSFTANGDPALADGSPGSGVEPSSLPAPSQTFNNERNAQRQRDRRRQGRQRLLARLALRFRWTPLRRHSTIKCPTSAIVGEAGVTASVRRLRRGVGPRERSQRDSWR